MRPSPDPDDATPTGPGAGSDGIGGEPAEPASRPGEPHGDEPQADEPTPGGPRDAEAPGLLAQLRATRDAAIAMLRAHVDLVRAELAEIGAEIARAAGLVLAALGCLVLVGLLLFTGGILFVGEWVFGSIGWGLLLGTEALLVVAIGALLAAVRAGGAQRAAATAGVTLIVLGVVFGASLTNSLWTAVGAVILPGVEVGVRPLAAAELVLMAAFAALGLLLGAWRWRAKGAVAGIAAGLLAGALIGALTAVAPGPRVGIALALAVSLAVFATIWGWLARSRLDPEDLKKRFIPQATIDTTKETIEWAKAQKPLGPGS